MRARSLVAGLALLAAGCQINLGLTLEKVDAFVPPDFDAGTAVGVDTGPRPDGGPRHDAETPDAGEPCPLLGELRCEGECVDVSTSSSNCGGCGSGCFGRGECVGGACACDATMCGDFCADLQTSSVHCGACGRGCEMEEECVGGECRTCATVCSGFCTDPLTSWTHCGGCNARCDGGEDCVGGVCVPSCPAGAHRCDGVCVSRNSQTHCGACSNRCGDLSACEDGACVACSDAGRLQCASGCVDAMRDLAHCGGCDEPCYAGAFFGEYCASGTCLLAPSDVFAANWGAECDACISTVGADGVCGGSSACFGNACRRCLESGESLRGGCMDECAGCEPFRYSCAGEYCPECEIRAWAE